MTLPSTRRSRRARVLLAAALAVGCMGPMARAAVPEYAVKAALIYKIGKFVRWPEQVPADSAAPFRICVVGHDDFGDNLDSIAGLRMRGQPVAIERYAQGLPAAGRCQVVFVSRSERARLTTLLGDSALAGALTISDIDDFAAQGGMVELRTSNGRVSFLINLGVSGHSGVEYSAQLLQLATVVGNPRPEPSR